MAVKTKALIDVEIIVHREIAKAEDQFVPSIVSACIRKAWEWRGMAGNADPVLCFSSKQNFRKVLCPTYKAHRPPSPPILGEVIKELKAKMPHMQIDGLEADDVIGILHTSQVYGPTRVVTIDKDMKTLPGWLINPDDILRHQQPITQEEADRTWFQQAVIGDTADGFKGIPKCGPKAADKIFGWDDVLEMGLDKGMDEDYLILQARLARILRRDDYDKESNSIRLWHPTDDVRFDLEKMEIAA
jgi:DNA polymerase-1